MSYNNRSYNTRNSGRFNTPGRFVPAGGQEFGSQAPNVPVVQPQYKQSPPSPAPQQQYQNQQQQFQNQQEQDCQSKMEAEETKDVEMQQDADGAEGDAWGNEDDPARPHWMKSKLPGVKKISKKERRRRQNEHLRRLLVPKNALMVLNEMMLQDQIANQFKVEPATNNSYFKAQNKPNFCADLTLEGTTYKGYGENKLMARNAAAEQAIRDLIIKRLSKACTETSGDASESQNGDGAENEALPMIQIASFALHKLFLEWEFEGHKVPQLKPPSTPSTSEAEAELGGAARACVGVVKKPKELPLNARAMHPCMLLTYMRPHMEYRELAVEGDRPQNMLFTMGVEVDGTTYVGKASNKKEARKAAAKAACQALFDVKFDDVATANAPQPPPQPQPQPQPAVATQ
ncbi:double-stranded RNA-specific editase B2 isoform 2-T2 [Aphomia sociella]